MAGMAGNHTCAADIGGRVAVERFRVRRVGHEVAKKACSKDSVAVDGVADELV